MSGWFFQCFEKGIGGADRHAIRLVDQADFPIADQRAIDHLVLDVANQLDLDLRIGLLSIRLDDHEIGMGARCNLATGSAGAAAVRFRIGRQCLAEQRLRKT